MIRKIQDAMSPAKGSSLAKAFWRLGWTGFWVQVILGSLPVALMLYYLLFTKVTADPRRGVPFVELLTMANLAILVFTILWSFRYTRLAKRIADPARRPGEAAVSKTAWTGVTASTIGMFFSAFVLLIEAATLLFYFLKAPQAGMPVIQTGASESIHWVSTIDVLSMVALTLTLIAEIIVLMLSLWLLFRTTVSSPEYPKPEVA
jgi:hypothetical protein